jgi:hypothetical protein
MPSASLGQDAALSLGIGHGAWGREQHGFIRELVQEVSYSQIAVYRLLLLTAVSALTAVNILCQCGRWHDGVGRIPLSSEEYQGRRSQEHMC